MKNKNKLDKVFATLVESVKTKSRTIASVLTQDHQVLLSLRFQNSIDSRIQTKTSKHYFVSNCKSYLPTGQRGAGADWVSEKGGLPAVGGGTKGFQDWVHHREEGCCETRSGKEGVRGA